MPLDNDRPAMETRKLELAVPLDKGAAAYRIGLIALGSDEATERDFHRMLPGDDSVMFYTSRVNHFNPVTVENLRRMGPFIAEAARQILPGAPLDAIAYSCTSGGVALGPEAVEELVAQGRPDVPVTMPITAALAAFEALDIKKISFMTPYVDSVNQPMRHFLEDHGITVLNMASFCLDSDVDMACVPPEAIRAAALECCHPEADALFVSCTALRAAETLPGLEESLGKPALSAIQCMFWHALRLSGYDAPLEGHGSLLRV